MPRSLALLTVFVFILLASLPVRAAGVRFAVPAYLAVAKDEAADKADAPPAKDAGSIDGQVTSVDYGAGKISVKAAGTRYDIVVLPSTSIQGKPNDAFHTIADIHKGAHVQVIMSQRAGAYTAQIIRLL